jgi:hypothetical protein
MKKSGKYLSIAIAAILLVTVASIWLVIANLDSIVERIVEDAGSEAIGTTVSLESAEVKLANASAALRGLAIENPAGYSEKYAFELGAIEVAIDPETVTGNEVVLPKVVVDRASLTFEQKGNSNNLQALLDNLSSSTGSSGESASDDSEEMTLVITEFVLAGTAMTILHDQLDDPVSFVLPDIVLTNIGRVGAGVTAQQAAQQIIEPILDRAQDAAIDKAKDELESRAREELDKQKDDAIKSATRKLFGD